VAQLHQATSLFIASRIAPHQIQRNAPLDRRRAIGLGKRAGERLIPE
jgi:hypothetical protein